MSVRRSSRLVKSSTDLIEESVMPTITEGRRRKRQSIINEATTTTTKTTTKKTKRVKKEDIINSSGEPKNWRIVFQRIKEYREKVPAPVDTMGCERLAETDVPERVSRFQTLVSLMLSSQTKDTVTSVAVKKLQKGLPGGLCLESILNVDESVLDNYIQSVGFHTKKASYIKRVAVILRDKYDGDIPDTIEGLTSLPGVGPKMGYLTLQCAWKKNLGIGVDIHVHRITNRLAWCNTMKGTPEDTRKSLESWLPKEHWREINPMLVGFGQVTCLPRGPRCFECPVNDLCPSAETKKVRVKKEVIKKEEIEIEQAIPVPADTDIPLIKNEPLDW
ncbi:DNA N-glycosylase and apurinic/apyrimidinic (AP) lyase [Apophysomyces ossiformis]|uniref:Endonuclease III homolog n=1 Tax=Apophysomyces ossiformis TaxID=679940 RepID=A0A8H7ES07_9FUNG|nr:DNA N-glycosylase and apurinic/apyrimidinic (AP) lyase [Apophysomyces ossiformis]